MPDKLCANHRAFPCRECGTKHYPECECYFCGDDAEKCEKVDELIGEKFSGHKFSEVIELAAMQNAEHCIHSESEAMAILARCEGALRAAADLIAGQEKRIGELEGELARVYGNHKEMAPLISEVTEKYRAIESERNSLKAMLREFPEADGDFGPEYDKIYNRAQELLK